MTHRRRPKGGAQAGGESPGHPGARSVGPGTKAALRRLAEADGQRYLLRLYITGMSRSSRQAVERVREFCETRLAGRYELEVVDIYQLPALAKDEQIVATPTLIRVLPAPLRRFIGSMASLDRFLFGMDLRPKDGA